MAKIRIPFYKVCQFDSLNEIVQGWEADEGRWGCALPEIVQYNVRYRDILRSRGMEFLIDSMVKEAPGLGKMAKAIDSLREWWDKQMHRNIADYDIQCYGVEERFTVLGHTFTGYDDVKSHCELSSGGYSGGMSWSHRPAYCVGSYNDIYIGKVYYPYPKFDSSDAAYEHRSFENYIFRNNPITETDLIVLFEMKTDGKSKVHEHIPEDCLPILYRDGDNPHFLLATAKPDPAQHEYMLHRLNLFLKKR